MGRECSPGGDLSRDLDEGREGSEPRPGEGASSRGNGQSRGPAGVGLACLRLGKKVRIGEWSKPVAMAGCKVSPYQKADYAGILEVRIFGGPRAGG